ncbi:hypothetical protein [Paenibacillus flagellatus]|uniref:Uncharacterized protein n=1 Tax=Paenibacillus flagellatus TaxID=2211139 RepID=A0A2V5KC25_9BACL|nr:hypothetical protein [Paenibacillus flagellatus]PYI57139.1 hypothetical protein DLM86_01465 [Paenibacillus flagellatus]
MDRNPQQVPYGYEPPGETTKGTLFVYDSFDLGDEADGPATDGSLGEIGLRLLADWAERRSLSRIALYVPHEETLKRMGVKFPPPMYKREDALQEAVGRLPCAVRLDIDTYERKRKKYTPMDVALRYMAERYESPYFLGLSGAYANRFASYQGFEQWIRQIRLVVAQEGRFEPHPLLVKHESRWNRLGE